MHTAEVLARRVLGHARMSSGARDEVVDLPT